MKKLMALTFSILTISSAAHAGWFSSNKPERPAPPAPVRGVRVSDCAMSLYQNLNTFESQANAACRKGRTDLLSKNVQLI